VLPNLRWEGPQHFRWWASYLDPDYDPETDAPPRVWLAWTLRGKCRETAASCLLNQWSRADWPEGWDAALALLAAVPPSTQYEFEQAVAAARWPTPPAAKPMQGAAQSRDYFEDIGR
jgi:hypothetical protein